jgi:imidazolonepropionase-like amidohydrolase
MRRIKKALMICFLIFGLFNVSFSEGKEAKDEAIFIKGGTVYTISQGVIHEGCILIQDGKIQKIGRNIGAPENALVLNAKDKWIMPGFVVVQASPFGMYTLIKQDRNPRIINYIDPFSLELRLCLAAGITSLSPNLAASYRFGRGRKNYSFFNAVIKPVYGSLKEIMVKEPAYLFISMSALKPTEKNELRGFFLRAGEFISKQLEYEKSKDVKKAKPPVLPPDLKNYVAVLKKELPVVFRADRKNDILKTLAFVDEFNMRALMLGATEGWLLAEDIGSRNISTILMPEAFIATDPYEILPNGSNIKNALIQKEKGVRFALLSSSPSIGTGGMLGTDLLTFPLACAYAIRGGLEEKDALRAITLTPAEQLGIAHRVGSLEIGKDADIIILDGNPFDYRSYVDYTIINGKLLYDKSKSSLFKKIPKPKRVF